MIISKYREGSDITILNTLRDRPKKDENTGKWTKDTLTVVYKDNVSGTKAFQTYIDPDYHFYMAKPEIETPHNMLFIEKDKVDEYISPFSGVLKTIAEKTNNTEFFYNNIKSGNRRANSELHTIPNVFGSDSDIEDHYRFLFGQQYKNTITPVSIGYLDIEVDIRYAVGDFPLPGECPINVLTYIDDKTKTINTFILRDYDNPLIEKFEGLVKNGSIFSEVASFIKSKIPDNELYETMGIENYTINFNFFDTEIVLITALFDLINSIKPDFCIAWNMAFDIPYIMERIIALGYNPENIMCHPDFDHKVARYYIDERHSNMYELRGDFYTISSYTVYLDQLIQFASRRKGQSAFPNFKLDTAGEIIAGVTKVDYSDIATMKDLPQVNFILFVLYNIIDVVVQKAIECKGNDIDYIYNTSVLDDTRYSKCHRQTVYLVNKFRKFCFNKGYIVGNNINLNNEAVSFLGALVGNPMHNSDYAKYCNNGEILNIYNNLNDFDYRALYPSIADEHNTAPNTMIGKIVISNIVHELENTFLNDGYDRGGEFLENMNTDNPLELSKRWLHLAGIKDLLDDIDEYMTTIEVQNSNYDGNTRPFVILAKTGEIVPFVIGEEQYQKSPFIMLPDSETVSKALIQIGGIH